MKQDIFDILKQHHEFHNGDESWYTPIENEEDAIQYLREAGKTISDQDRISHRWWDTFIRVKEFEFESPTSYYIGYEEARSTRDLTAEESGWDFNPNIIKEYAAKEVTTIIYEPI